MIRGFHDLHTLLTILATLVHLAQHVFWQIKCIGVLPANIPDLGSILPNMGKLSAGDVEDSLGLGGHFVNWFLKGWSFWQTTELIHPPVNKN
jgi:hypothetical protein